MTFRHALVAVVLAASAAPFSASPTAASPPPAAPQCALFPANNVWNAPIAGLPVHTRSTQWIGAMGGTGQRLHPDFGSSGDPANPYGIPYTVVDNSHATVPVTFDYAGESDLGPYPLGSDTPIEGGPASTGDRHALIVNRDSCRLYELYNTHYSAAGSTAGSGAAFDLRSNALRPDTWTSADAAGLPILPGLLRADEVAGGVVNHAIRFTAMRTDRSHLWPARHDAGAASDPALPPMGARFRMRSGVDITGYSPATRVVLRAMQTYGLILADNGSNWYISGSAENSWDPAMISQLKTIPAGDFEAVDESSLMVDPNSGATGTAPSRGHLKPLPAVSASVVAGTPPPSIAARGVALHPELAVGQPAPAALSRRARSLPPGTVANSVAGSSLSGRWPNTVSRRP